MKNLVLIFVALLVFTSCQNEEIEILTSEQHMDTPQLRSGAYLDYSDDESYSLEEFIKLDHNQYGLDFMDRHLDNVVDNISRLDPSDLEDVERRRGPFAFRFRWNGCDPLGACLIIYIRSADPGDTDLTECIAGVRNGKLIVIPQGPSNGMLSDGYIFVDPIEMDKETCDELGVPNGTEIKAGIYKSGLPSADYKYGYHVFDLVK